MAVFTGDSPFDDCQKQHRCHHAIDSKCGLALLKGRYHAVQISPEDYVENLKRAETTFALIEES